MKIENIMGFRRSELHGTGITVSRIRISNVTAHAIRERYHPTRISNWLFKIKVEKPIKKGYIDVKAIRVYITELMKNINSTVERGEKPYLLVKKAYSPKRGENEIEMVFMASKQKHIEELTYFRKHPSQWPSWGEIVWSEQQIRDLIKLLNDLLEA